jgi:hypothetical protein
VPPPRIEPIMLGIAVLLLLSIVASKISARFSIPAPKP